MNTSGGLRLHVVRGLPPRLKATRVERKASGRRGDPAWRGEERRRDGVLPAGLVVQV